MSDVNLIVAIMKYLGQLMAARDWIATLIFNGRIVWFSYFAFSWLQKNNLFPGKTVGGFGKCLLGSKSHFSSQLLHVFPLDSSASLAPVLEKDIFGGGERGVSVSTDTSLISTEELKYWHQSFFLFRTITDIKSPANYLVGSQMVDKENASSRWQSAHALP